MTTSKDSISQTFVLGVDLDGVVADFYEGLRPIAAEWLGKEEDKLTRDVTYGLSEWQLDAAGGYDRLHQFAVTQRNLFTTLKPIGNAAPVLRRLSCEQDVRIRIITHRLYIKHFHQQAVAQTIQWLDHFGIPYWDICFMKDKASVGADLYLEDAPSNVMAMREAGLDVVVFGNSTNQGLEPPRFTDWDRLHEFILTKLSAWRLQKHPKPSIASVPAPSNPPRREVAG